MLMMKMVMMTTIEIFVENTRMMVVKIIIRSLSKNLSCGRKSYSLLPLEDLEAMVLPTEKGAYVGSGRIVCTNLLALY